MAKLIMLIAMTFSLSAFAKANAVQFNFLNAVLNNQTEIDLKNPPLPDRCLPPEDTSSCIKSVCARMPSYKCDDLSELQEAAKVCKNNYNGQCVDFSCSKMAGYNCDDLAEVGLVASSCQHVYGNACQALFVSKLASYEYDSVDEWVAINTSCRYATADAVKCVDYTCSRLSGHKCDDLDEVRDILNACISQ